MRQWNGVVSAVHSLILEISLGSATQKENVLRNLGIDISSKKDNLKKQIQLGFHVIKYNESRP